MFKSAIRVGTSTRAVPRRCRGCVVASGGGNMANLCRCGGGFSRLSPTFVFDGPVLRAPDVHLRAAAGSVRIRSDQVDTQLDTEFGNLIEDLVHRGARTAPSLRKSRVIDTTLGLATYPADGLPSAGALPAVPGYYEAFANSRVTLAPLLGRLLAEQISSGTVPEQLAASAPDRLRKPDQTSPVAASEARST